MNSRTFVTALLSVIAGLIGGFVLANTLNRTEINSLKSLVEQKKAASTGEKGQNDDLNIGAEEIKAKISEADANPTNFAYQKNLGLALYRYATMKKDTPLLDESTRILVRANSIDTKDYDVIVGLGNAYFDAGYFKKDQAAIKRSRDFYAKALESKPNDADVRTDMALSYFVDEPPDLSRSVEQFQKALAVNPKHERALQFLAQVYVKQNDYANASKTLEQLKAVNPKNETIAEITTQIASGGPATAK